MGLVGHATRRAVRAAISKVEASRLQRLVNRGLRLGVGVHVGPGVFLDPSHCWLIDVGDRVTLAPGVRIFAHDASTKGQLGYTRIGRVAIGEGTFIGAGALLLPGVSVGSNAIVAAGSVVTGDVPPGVVVAGNPARVIATLEEYVLRRQAEMAGRPRWPARGWTLGGGILASAKDEQRTRLADGPGYVE